MTRRLMLIVLAATLSLGVAVPAAHGWGNGGGDGNTYGTHDWIMEHAMVQAGAAASWVDTSTALLATDDPDHESNKYKHQSWEHGIYGGAPQAVSDNYYSAVLAYGAGDTVTASRYLGALSHYYSDICNPFHSSYEATHRLGVKYHGDYERSLHKYTGKPGISPDWITPVARQPITNIRAKTLAAAAFTRPMYIPLRQALRKMPTSAIDVTLTVRATTIASLDRAVNDLADIIAAIPTGTGLAPAPTGLTLHMDGRHPAPGARVAMHAHATDAAGKPMMGVGVTFSLPTKSGGTEQYLAWTGSNGIARNYRSLPPVPLGTKQSVSVAYSSGGVSLSASSWIRPTATLRSGTKGMRAAVSKTRPRRGTVVTVAAIVHNTKGHHVANVPVTFTWKSGSKVFSVVVLTGANGIARVSRSTSEYSKGRRVYVTMKAPSGGKTRTVKTSFKPK